MRVAVTRKGKSLKRASLVLDTAAQRRAGRPIVEAIRRNVAAGMLADGTPAPPDLHGDGRSLYETGTLLKSIKARASKTRGLTVGPDYRKVLYAIYLINGVNKRRTEERIAKREMRRRRTYKRESDMVLEPRPFVGMDIDTLRKVANENEKSFKSWFDGLSIGARRGR